MLQRIGVFPPTMVRFAPWATGLRAAFRVSQSGLSGATHFRLLSSLPGRTEQVAPKEESDSKESPGAQFQNDGVKLVDHTTSPNTKNRHVKVETMSVLREKVSVAELLQDLPPEKQKIPEARKRPNAILELAKTSDTESLSLDPIQMLTELRSNSRAIEMLKEIDNSKLITVFLSFTRSGSRPTPVLNEIAARLLAYPSTFTPKECGVLLFCMSRLYFPNCALAAKVCTDLLPAIENLQSFELNGITKSIGRLHYRNNELMAKICQWYEKNIETVKASEILDLMCTLAYLDYRPENKEVFTKMLPQLKGDLSTPAWLDLIHSLVILGWATPELLDSYFKEDLTRWSNVATANRVTLVQSYAQIKYKENYSHIGGTNNSVTNSISTQTYEALKKVIKVLSIFGSTDHVKLNDLSPHGLPIHATFLLDKNARIVSGVQRNSSPQNAARIALMVWQYRDVVLPDCDKPLGPNRCVEELLELEGYQVVRIPLSFSSSSHVENTIFFEKTLQEISSKLKT